MPVCIEKINCYIDRPAFSKVRKQKKRQRFSISILIFGTFHLGIENNIDIEIDIEFDINVEIDIALRELHSYM